MSLFQRMIAVSIFRAVDEAAERRLNTMLAVFTVYTLREIISLIESNLTPSNFLIAHIPTVVRTVAEHENSRKICRK